MWWEIVLSACFVLPSYGPAEPDCIYDRSGVRDGVVFETKSACTKQANIAMTEWKIKARIVGAEVTSSSSRCEKFPPPEEM